MTTKILLVDDNETLLRQVGSFLRKKGFDVITASDGHEAISAWETHSPDLILLDINLESEPSGLRVCRTIKASDDVPIIFLTARKSPTDAVQGFKFGADDYVPKPFDEEELVARIKARLPPEELIVDNYLHINMAEHDVRIRVGDGLTSAKLRPKEKDLLFELARHIGRPLPQTYLLGKVFDQAAAHSERTQKLKKTVYDLRQKIEPEPGKPRYVVTVFGAGYKLVNK